jgi:hypothetical protein
LQTWIPPNPFDPDLFLVCIARGVEDAVIKHRLFATEEGAVNPSILAVQVIMGEKQSAQNVGVATDVVFDRDERGLTLTPRSLTEWNALFVTMHINQAWRSFMSGPIAERL